MRYLVIGNGARESAILWKLHQDEPEAELFCLPGNGGTQNWATNVEMDAKNIEQVVAFAKEEKMDMTIVGPEQPLVDGMVDAFRREGLVIIGPDKETAKLEGSKAFAKEFMKKYQIPTARYETYDTYEDAKKALDTWKYPFVIKADGLASGKGVLIVNKRQEAEDGLAQMMLERKFGNAGEKVVFEEFLEGTEASYLCFVDGNTIIPMESARDYKRAYDEDKGLNTGGMGCFSPNPILQNQEILTEIRESILEPIRYGIKDCGMDYRGILFIGLMLTMEGVKVLEFNVRFGDPETEVLLPRLGSKLSDIFWAVHHRRLQEITPEWREEACVCIVLASAGYPEAFESGKPIEVEDAQSSEMIFYGGVRKKEETLLTAGGRVIVVAAYGDSLSKARENAYCMIDKIRFDGMWYRRDIAKIEK